MFRWFETRVDPFQSYDDTKPLPRTLKPFFVTMRWVILVALIFGGLAGLAEVLVFSYMQRIVDLLGEASPETIWQLHGREMLFMAFVALFLRPLVDLIAITVTNLSYLPPVAALVRWRAHRQVLRQSLGYFQNDFAGRIAQKIVQTGPAVGDGFYTVLDALWYALIYAVAAVVLLAEFDWRLMMVFGVWLIAYIALAVWIVPRIGQSAKEMSEARSMMTGRIVDSYTNIQTVKLFAHTDREDAYALESITDTYTTFRKQMRLFTIMEALLLLNNTALTAGVCGLSVWLWSIGEIGVGAVAAGTALELRMGAMTGWIMWSLSQLYQNLGVTMEGVETITKPVEITDAPEAKRLSVKKGGIHFDTAHFMYGRDVGGVDGIDLTIKPGERIGLVGRSGAGKSTFVNLLLRFYDLESGRIVIDGQDIARVTQDSLRAHISVVTQDTALLHRSVMDNIRYGRPEATEAQAFAAAKRARAHDFIADLADPDGRKGYDAQVGERGVKLSGGQRQRIAIARAILKDAPILVLDEATSALDSEVEAEIQEELASLMEGKTVIAIAHRLSTIAHLDRIVVMDKGRIAEQGSHTELLERDGLYAGFWKRQSGGFLDLEGE
jgi:ATP-binding cassette subfamily B multidrug efflux pump